MPSFAATTAVVLLVLNDEPDGAFVTVTLVVYWEVPPPAPHVASSYSVNVSVPFRLASPVSVAVSFGTQLCAVVKPELPVTVKHSPGLAVKLPPLSW